MRKGERKSKGEGLSVFNDYAFLWRFMEGIRAVKERDALLKEVTKMRCQVCGAVETGGDEMIHGTKVGGGYKTGDPVRVTSKEDFVVNAPGVVTGKRDDERIRVRLRVGTNTTSVFVLPDKLTREEKTG